MERKHSYYMNNNELYNSFFGLHLGGELGRTSANLVYPWNRHRVTKEYMIQCLLTAKIPFTISEKAFPKSILSPFDKIFACHWINESNVITGSKDNKLILWDTKSKPLSYRIIEKPSPYTRLPNDNCGIHTISMNPQRTYLATGSTNPNEIVIYSVPDFKIKNVLVGHSDWLFGSAFLSENVVVSASRDTKIGLWHIPHVEKEIPTEWSQNKHIRTTKIRDVKANTLLNQFTTLRSDGIVNIWNERFSELLEIRLLDRNDVVCMDWEEKQNIIGVGSQSRLTLVDPRLNKITHSIPSLDEECGIRSLCINNFMISVGGGKGRLSFLDLRTNRYLHVDSSPYTPEKCYYDISKGIVRCDLIQNYTLLEDQPTAIYAHQYDPSGTRIFTGGGPLLASMSGCYAALWR